MNLRLIKNQTDSQITEEEISRLKEQYNKLKKQTITKDNIDLLQQLDTELTDKLKQYISYT